MQSKMKAAFDMLRKEIKNVNSAADITPEILTALWTMSIFSTLEHLRRIAPEEANDEDHLEMARMMALKHFDITLLDSYGIKPEEFE